MKWILRYHLPDFDSYDEIEAENRIEYALVQRFTARFEQDEGAPTYRELVYLRLSQSYYLDDVSDDDSGGESFSGVRGELTLLPTTWSSLRIDSTLDLDRGEWSKIAVEAEVHDQQENRLAATYRNDRDEEIDYASLSLDVAFLKPIYLHYEKRYDFATDEQLEDVLAVEYRQQCWSALLTFRENDTDRSILLSFEMKGLGPVGGVSGSLGGS